MKKEIAIQVRWKRISLVLIGLLVAIVFFTVLREAHSFVTSTSFYGDFVREESIRKLKDEIGNRQDEIRSILADNETEFRNELHEQVTLAHFLGKQAVEDMDPSATLEEKREVYLGVIDDYDRGVEDNYYFCADSNGILLLDRINTPNIGSSVWNLQDPVTGSYFVQEMVYLSDDSETNGDFVNYHWPKEEGGEYLLKTSYVYYYEELDLVIGTGHYYEDYIESSKIELFDRINDYYIDDSEYIYVVGYDATVYAHIDPDLNEEAIRALHDDDGNNVHNGIVSGVEDKGYYTFSYSYPDLEGNIRSKFGYAEAIEGWDMYIGQSIYLDDISLLEQEYFRSLIPGFIISVVLILIISISSAFLIRRMINLNFSQITRDFKEQNAIITQMNFTDQLTGLYNRKYFDPAYEKLKKEQEHCAIIVGDANGLKLTNDAFGHEAGDKLLKEIARLLSTVFHQSEVFRWGGDEFLILSKLTKEEDVEEKIREFQNISDNMNVENMTISVSMGYSVFDVKAANPYEEMNEAEKMMYNKKTTESRSTKRKIIDSILHALYDTHNFEKVHSENVMRNALSIGHALGLNKDELGKLRLGALLHDIGKISIPDSVINKPTTLTDKEYEEIRKHSEKGFRILSAYPELSEYGYIVLHHHEAFDGTGYPEGLKGESIPLYSRIISVADAYDAMVEHRVYREPMTKEQAHQELIRCKGTQFDPVIVDLFIQNNN